MPLGELRNMLSYVPQDAYLFDASVKENIACGKPGATDAEIIAAFLRQAVVQRVCQDFCVACFAAVYDRVTHNGYDTIVGERGETLSGGQRQRIAIARAFLKNAPILLLDEATSALDNRTEERINRAIEELSKANRELTIIVVAHRESSLDYCDRIITLGEKTA